MDLVLSAPRESGLRVRAADREGVVGLVHAVGRGLPHAEGVAPLVIALGFRAKSCAGFRAFKLLSSKWNDFRDFFLRTKMPL